jgi:hypothetical protein
MNGEDKSNRRYDGLDHTPDVLEIGTEPAAAASSSLDPAMSLKEEECPSLTTEDVGKTSGSLIESSGVVARSRSDVWKTFYITEEGGVMFAVCKICTRKLKQSKTAGTGTLRNL